MRTYNVFFELFGKKYQMKVQAKNKFDAEEVVKDKIVFHKIDDLTPPEKSDEDDLYDTTRTILKKLFNY